MTKFRILLFFLVIFLVIQDFHEPLLKFIGIPARNSIVGDFGEQVATFRKLIEQRSGDSQ